MKESFLQTFSRTALRADFKSDDNVPILRSKFFDVFGSSVGEINKMSKVARTFEYIWFAFAFLLTLGVTIIGIILALPTGNRSDITLVAAIFLALVWVFCVIQFLSLLGYFRFRLRK